jgi:methionyl-tRNA synthetase
MSDHVYITTAIPYVNGAPHIGHALEFVQADAIARYHKLLGKQVLLLSGGDENALKNVQAADSAGQDVQTFVDEHSEAFRQVAQALHVEFDVFQKGSDTAHHYPSSQQLWNLCAAAGDIYKKAYDGLYCIGCEAFYTPAELNENGECPEHPGKPLQKIQEQNYFFNLKKYESEIVRRIETGEVSIIPEFRKNEVLSFLKQGLEDISISRSNERARNWGVPVPNDDTQRIYVWFDALNIYQSGIGFGWNDQMYNTWWPASVHVIGKGISRFHAIYWLAFLLSAKLALPKEIFIHGYFTVQGQKMGKSIGNVINPLGLIQTYGVDPLRYYFLREIPAYNDGDFTEARLKELYTADLANGIGNLVARVAKLASLIPPDTYKVEKESHQSFFQRIVPPEYTKAFDEYLFNDALSLIWKNIKKLDVYINDTKPWSLPTEQQIPILTKAIEEIRIIACLLLPFLPHTAETILDQYTQEHITPQPPLFPRLS